MSKFNLEEVLSEEKWDNFLKTSKENTIFMQSYYFKAITTNYKLFFINKGKETKAAFFILSQKNTDIEDLIIYSGIHFGISHEKRTKDIQLRFELSEYLIKEIENKYTHFTFSLSPNILDARPFLWHNYHSKDIKDKLTIDIRYTSYINISSLANFDNEENTALFKGLEVLRQRNIREARSKSAKTYISNNINLFLEYYTQLMLSQNIIVSEYKLTLMSNLINTLIKNKKAKIYISKNNQDYIQYITIFCWDNLRAYYLFGAPNPLAKERYKGTITFWDAFLDLAKMGINEIDMEGVNSPQRGKFKLSFGGELKPYFRISSDKSLVL